MEFISVNEIMGTLRRRWLLIAGIALLAAVGGYVAAKTIMPTEWGTKVTLLLEPSSPSSSSDMLSLLAGSRAASSSTATFISVLRSRTLRERVAEKLDLAKAFEVGGVRAAGGQLASMLNVESRGGILTISIESEGDSLVFLNDEEKLATGKLIADIANTYASELQEYLSNTDFTRASARRKFLGEQLERTDRELLAAEDALVAYATDHGMVSPSSQSGAAVEGLKQLRARELDLRVSIEGARKTLAAAMADLNSQDRLMVSSVSERRNPALDRLHARALDIQREIAEQMEIQGKSEQHPDVQALTVELAEAQSQISEELENEMYAGSQQLTVDPSYSSLVKTVLNTQLEVSGLEAKLSTVRAAKGQALAEVREMPATSTRYGQLQREVKLKTSAYQRLAEQFEAARVSEAAAVPKFAVLDEALPKRNPSGPSASKFAILGLFAGGFFAVLLAFWLDFRLAARERGPQREAMRPGNGEQ